MSSPTRSVVARATMPSVATAVQVRAKNDYITKRAGKFGRSSVGGHVVTVFGASGFIARYVVNRLARQGMQIVTPYRGIEDDVMRLRQMGDVGQVIATDFHLRDVESVRKCVRYSDTVINLMGKPYQTRNFSYDAVFHEGAERVAEACAAEGVDRLIHFSHLNQNADSDSIMLKAKAKGEAAVRAAFPDATIVRPSDVMGEEDRFLCRIGEVLRLPVLGNPVFGKLPFIGVPLVDGGGQFKQPVHVVDIAKAVTLMVKDPSTAGKTYELVGPNRYTFYEILLLASRLLHMRRLPVAHFPKWFMLGMGKAIEQNPIYRPFFTADEVARFLVDDKEPTEAGFAELGIKPMSYEKTGETILRKFRKGAWVDEPADISELS